ncbi:MAG: SdpI family protein [Heliobacteriaceae bacterium]|nr:SdpI family protein [Heliobacteriaceae bacterium]
MNLKERKNTYRLSWQTLRQDWPLWVLMAGLLVAGILVYPHLPEQVPSHWNFRGEVDAYTSRPLGAFFPPFLVLGLYVLMRFLPLIDPRRENYRRFGGAYRFLCWGIVLFGSAMYVVTILAALDYPVKMGLIVKGLVAVLFIIIGNFMSQIRHNYFVGIKTPWTLANEDVWQQTHRVGARVWVLGGLVCLATAPVEAVWGAYVFFAAVAVMVLIPTIYSYVLFRAVKPG